MMTTTARDVHIIDSPAPLIDALIRQGWRVIGPRESDGAIVYDEIASADDLPRGRVDEQEAGHYRLTDGRPDSWFDYVVGPQSWKKWLFPARRKLWSASKSGDGFEIDTSAEPWPKTAFFGVRACELAAIERQDEVFDNGSFADADYQQRRAASLSIVVQCARSAATCFCASMNTGPRADKGFDLALSELGGNGDRFLLEIGSEKGDAIARDIEKQAAVQADLDAAGAAASAAAASQTRMMPAHIDLLLKDNHDHPGWDDIAAKCLSCANCTLACPTCFCSDVEEVNDLSGDHTERWRVWDSCFSVDFSYIHGGSVRRSTQSRYRQWMTHKLSSWIDQFGSSGCVGCGRCIAWCPVGIDITREAAAIAGDKE